MKAILPIVGSIALLLSGCDRAREPEPVEPASSNAASAAANGGEESIIRDDVRAEVEMPPEAEASSDEAVLYFQEREWKLPPEATQQLDRFLASSAVAKGACVIIRGHSDTRGSDQQNLAASRRRAELVRDYLLSKGLGNDRLQLIALGEQRPVAPNANPDGSDFPEGRAKNRRVELEAQLAPNGRAETCAAPDVGSSPEPEKAGAPLNPAPPHASARAKHRS